MGNKKELYIGLTGIMATGKGESAKILKKLGFKYISLSDIVRAEAAKTDKQVTREEMQDIGNMLRGKGGEGILAKKVREKISESKQKKWVIDGIRNPAEVTELKKLNSFFLVGLTTPLYTIINRIKKRKRDTDTGDEIETKKRIERERGIGESKYGQQVEKCLLIADFTIKNNRTIKNLESNILKILNKIGEKNGK
jgi:dephospho-CoA kinase